MEKPCAPRLKRMLDENAPVRPVDVLPEQDYNRRHVPGAVDEPAGLAIVRDQGGAEWARADPPPESEG